MKIKCFLNLFFLGFLLFVLQIESNVPKYIDTWKNKDKHFDLIKDIYGHGNYLHPKYLKFINKNDIHFILEIGSRDAIDALELSKFYKVHVCAFECNPQALEICYHNVNENPNITIVPFAAWNETKISKFYPIVKEKKRNFNLGASSLFKMDPNGHDVSAQGEITVNTVRLDDWLNSQKYETPDLICIDAQGATLPILQGLGEKLFDVKYIIAECEFVRYYIGESLYPEIAAYLKENGFEELTQIKCLDYFANILFKRKDL